MKIKFWCYAQNCGDGSVAVRFYKTQAEAQAASDKDNEDYGENYCDEVSSHEFEVDENGNIVKGLDSDEY